MTRRPWILPCVSALLVGLTGGWLFVWKFKFGVPNEWQLQPNKFLWPAQAWLVPGAILGFFGGLAALAAYDRFRRAKTRKDKTNSTVLSILMLMCFATVWPWGLLARGDKGQFEDGGLMLVSAFYSDVSNEYFGTAWQVDDARQFTADYATRWQKPASIAQSHVATHPPGAVLFFHGARRFLEASPRVYGWFHAFAEWLCRARLDSVNHFGNQLRSSAARSSGAPPASELPVGAVPTALFSALLCSLALGLAVPAIYWIASGHPLAEDANEARGLLAAALFAFAPAAGLFAFSLDALIACGAVWTMALMARSAVGGRSAWMLGAGLVMGLTSFLSIGALAVAVVCVLALLPGARTDRFRFAAQLAAFFIGFGLAWLLLMVVFPMKPLEIFANAMHFHREASLTHRGRWSWAPMNLIMFAPFCGWVVVTACLSRKISGQNASALIGGAALAAVLVLTLSGNVRGEVERLWLFLVPPLCALAAAHIEPAKSRIWLPLLALQTLQSVMMAAGLAPLIKPIGFSSP